MKADQDHALIAGLADIADVLSGELDLDRLLPLVVSQARQTTGAAYGALGVLSPDGTRLIRFVHEGMAPAVVRTIGPHPRGLGLLGKLITEPSTIVTDDIANHPDAGGFPANHPPMQTFLGTPIRAGGRVFGNLYLCDAPGGFSPIDVTAAQLIAVQAGLAIQTAELAERLRTAAVQAERDRISRDLHDTVIQQLFSIGMSLESVRGQAGTDPDRVEARLDASVSSLDDTISALRATISALRPDGASDLGLQQGLLELAREYDDHTAMRPSVQIETTLDPTVPERVVPDVLQIVREALSNAVRHGGSQVRLVAGVHRQHLELTITDDGPGFDPATVVPGDGLRNLAERAALLGALLDVDATSGRGTTIRLTVPLDHDGWEDGPR